MRRRGLLAPTSSILPCKLIRIEFAIKSFKLYFLSLTISRYLSAHYASVKRGTASPPHDLVTQLDTLPNGGAPVALEEPRRGKGKIVVYSYRIQDNYSPKHPSNHR